MAVRILDKNGNIKTITTTVVTGETDPIWLVDKPDYLTILSASATYSVLGHTHTFASLTSKPTTIAGYGITDYNSLWDTRLALKTTTNLAEGTNLYFTDGRAVTALTGENISLFTNDSGYLTSLSGAVLIGRNLTINGTMQDLSADRSWTVGTVTSTSVVSANGFAGTVATNTTTPAITISTSITGLLKGNGTAISAAVSNTDYLPVASPTFTGPLTSTSGSISISGNITAFNIIATSLLRSAAASRIEHNGRNGFTATSDGFETLTSSAGTANTANLSVASLRTGYVAKTANYTATAFDETISCSTNAFTITLPTAVGCAGQKYNITNSTAANTITIGTTSSQVFANVTSTPTTISLVGLGAVIVVSDGAAWLQLK